MSTVSECLPRTARLLPDGERDRPLANATLAFVDLLAAVRLAAATKVSVFGVIQVGDAAMNDLDDLQTLDVLPRAQVDATRLAVGAFVAMAACLSGDIDAGRTWLVRGLGGEDTPQSKFTLAGIAFLRVVAAGSQNPTAVDAVCDFAYALFYMARTAGYLLEAVGEVGAELAVELAGFPISSSTLDAVPQALSWTRSVGREDLARPLRDWCRKAADVFDRHPPPPFHPTVALELRFAIAVSLDQGQARAVALKDCADRVDADCPGELAVQIIAAACDLDAERTRHLLPKLLNAISAAETEQAEVFAAEQVAALRERALDVIGPALMALARDGDVTNAVALLRAWAGVNDDPLSEVCADRVQLCIHGEEHVYAWAGGSCVAPVTVTSQEIATSTNQALGSALVATGPGAQKLHVPASGRVDRGAGFGFGQMCSDLLALEDCRDFTRKLDTSGLFIPIPGYRVPYQGLLAQRGQVPTMWISLREPAPDRWIERVLIAQGDTALSDLECELVAAIFSSVGVDVERVNASEGAAVADRVNHALETAEYDIIWIAAHGRQPDYEPLMAEIALPASRVLTGRELGVVPDDQTRRRLLVLSCCDSAATMQATGLRARGLAAAAAGPHQAVVGHQWVVNEKLAAAFGVLLAAAIAQNRDFSEGFSDALQWLQRPWTDNADLLAGFSLDDDLVDRLRGAAVFGENILDFGAPAFYC